MTIEVVMIVKNESEMLPRCLDSVKGADRITIVDTGSTDDTVKIAKKYTNKIYRFKWCDSFCKARNFADSKVDKATDWILSIDADEYLSEPLCEVKQWLKGFKGDLVKVKIQWENSDSYHYLPKLYRNQKHIFWKGDIHNYLSRSTEDISPFTFMTGYSPAHKKDPDRALRIARNVVDKDPSLVRERYYLAREYYYRRRWAEAIWELDLYLGRTQFRAEKADAYLMKARCLWYLKEGEKARIACMHAIYTNPDFEEALRFMAEMNYEPRKSKWLQFANLAQNKEVLFVRKVKQTPMSMAKEHIEYVKNLLKGYKKVSVLEWGSGYSTKFYPEFMQKEGIEYTWKAMEHDAKWNEVVKSWNVDNVEVVFAHKDSKVYLNPKGKYDVIFIDGRNRKQCLINARKLLKKNGVVILHDAERERYHEGMKGYEGEYIGQSIPRLWVGRDIIK